MVAQRLKLETWINIFRNLSEVDENVAEEFGVDVEVIWLDDTNEWILAHEYEMFEDGFKTEKEAMERLNQMEKLSGEIEEAEESDIDNINAYFAETGWELDSKLKVVKTGSIEAAAAYLHNDTTGLSYEELEEKLDVRNVWFDHENTCNYYIIVE